MTGNIYAVECNSRIKIGFSEDPQKRFNKIASDAPFPCVLLGYWPGDVSEELAFQELFRTVRVHGEWFAATEDLLSAIAARVVPHEEIRKARFTVQEGDSALAVWRKSKKIRGEDAAKELGVNRATWSRWETGSHKVPAEKAIEIEKVTGVPRHQIRPDLFERVVQ